MIFWLLILILKIFKKNKTRYIDLMKLSRTGNLRVIVYRCEIVGTLIRFHESNSRSIWKILEVFYT